MVRPRTPTNILKLRGADKVNPGRLKDRENEPVNKNPIGRAPTWLTALEKKAWKLIIKTCIDGVLGEADYIAVALASQLLARAMYPPEDLKDLMQGIDRALLLRYLGQFGMTPSERTKVSVPKSKPKNKFDD